MVKKQQEAGAEKQSLGSKKKIKAVLSRERVLAEDKGEARALYDTSRFGEPQNGKQVYSLVEACYLLEKKKMAITDEKKKKITVDRFIARARKVEPNFW